MSAQIEVLQHRKGHVSHIYLHPILFAEITGTNFVSINDGGSARVKNDVKLAAGLGEIVVYFHRCNLKLADDRHYAPTSLATALVEISEKALKGQAIYHGVRCVHFA